MTIKRHEAMILSGRRRSDTRQNFLPAIFLSPIVVAKFIFFVPISLFLRIWRQWRSVARTLVSEEPNIFQGGGGGCNIFQGGGGGVQLFPGGDGEGLNADLYRNQ